MLREYRPVLMSDRENHGRVLEASTLQRGADGPRPQARRVSAAQRTRIIAAMVPLVCERGVQDVTVTQVVKAAGVSRRTFYDQFADRDECMVAAMQHAAAVAAERAGPAWSAHVRWVDRVHAGLRALLELFEAEPRLAHLCIVRALQAGPATLACRLQLCDQLARLVDEGRAVARRQPHPLTAEATVGGALAVIHARLLEPTAEPLTDLLKPLMGHIVLPYLGAEATRTALSQPLPARSARLEPNAIAAPIYGAPARITYRTIGVLAAIAADPGLTNSQVSEKSGIADQGQASKLLGRLARVGLIENIGEGMTRNASKAWRLTASGELLERSARHELQTMRRSCTRQRGSLSGDRQIVEGRAYL